MNRYRYHKKNGTIHCISGCCSSGKPKGNTDNFVECMTIEEAEAQLEARHIVPSKCKKCKWTSGEDENREKKQ